MGLDERLKRLESARGRDLSLSAARSWTAHEWSSLTNAELDRLVDSIPDVNLRLLTDAELVGLEAVYAKAEATGEDESVFITPELEAALERVNR